ncbi:MAG: trypsin-like peptidase domain-containing protein [Brockia lithotrophica]|nr:trypsin-like peptidase domain-containing protein [Brockia lithotrophica]
MISGTNPRRLRPFVVASAFVLLLAFLAGGCAAGSGEGSAEGANDSPSPSAAAPSAGGKEAIFEQDGHSVVAEMVKKAGPAVVRIETRVAPGRNVPSSPFAPPFPFNFPQEPRGAIGSGFFIDDEGTILTNNHVIENASEIKVYLVDREEPLSARVVGRDPELDLAVLKVDGGPFPYIPLGDSEAMWVGDFVVAIGNPYGLDHTVTFGVISAKERPLTIQGQPFKNLLQTDASINPGNSGGPLLNLRGEVIGINTAVSAQGQGLGFAIPINSVKEVLNDLLTKGKVSRPWLGVSVQDLTPDVADSLGISGAKGALVMQVFPNSPAAKAGLQPNDVITSFDGKNVTSAQDLVNLIQESKVGEKKKLLVYRGGKLQSIEVTIGEKSYN